MFETSPTKSGFVPFYLNEKRPEYQSTSKPKTDKSPINNRKSIATERKSMNMNVPLQKSFNEMQQKSLNVTP